jgi:hypothetical protein
MVNSVIKKNLITQKSEKIPIMLNNISLYEKVNDKFNEDKMYKHLTEKNIINLSNNIQYFLFLSSQKWKYEDNTENEKTSTSYMEEINMDAENHHDHSIKIFNRGCFQKPDKISLRLNWMDSIRTIRSLKEMLKICSRNSLNPLRIRGSSRHKLKNPFISRGSVIKFASQIIRKLNNEIIESKKNDESFMMEIDSEKTYELFSLCHRNEYMNSMKTIFLFVMLITKTLLRNKVKKRDEILERFNNSILRKYESMNVGLLYCQSLDYIINIFQNKVMFSLEIYKHFSLNIIYRDDSNVDDKSLFFFKNRREKERNLNLEDRSKFIELLYDRYNGVIPRDRYYYAPSNKYMRNFLNKKGDVEKFIDDHTVKFFITNENKKRVLKKKDQILREHNAQKLYTFQRIIEFFPIPGEIFMINE